MGSVALMELGVCGATEGTFDDAATEIAAVQPCAFGAPLRGFGA